MTTINPKLLALAAQLDAAHECARRVEAQQNEDDDDIEIAAAKRLCAEAYAQISKLEFKLAKIAAANVEELLLKACYVDDFPWNFPGDHIAESIVRDVLALGRKPKAATSKEATKRKIHNA